MNCLSISSLVFLTSMLSTVSASVCYVCNFNPNLEISNYDIVHRLQNDRLLGQRLWSCPQLQNAGLSGRFNSQQCSDARDIAIRICGCRPLGYTPTVQQTAVCEFCPGSYPSNPSKLVSTFMGQLDCGTLVDGGRGRYWPDDTCEKLKNNGVQNQCCPGSGSNAPALGLVGCFSGSNSVDVEGKGSVLMKDIKIGDKVSVGDGKYSRVYSFGHRDTESSTEYLQIYSEGVASPLEITKEHMVFVERAGAVPASSVTVGDKVMMGDGSTRVTRISRVVRKGAYAPFTETGSLVVTSVLASSFISVKEGASSLSIGGVDVASLHWLAHAFEAPHRMVCRLSPSFCESESYTADGISLWVNVPYMASRWLMSQSAFLAGVLSVVVIMGCGLLYMLECVVSHLTCCGFLFILAVLARRSIKKCKQA